MSTSDSASPRRLCRYCGTVIEGDPVVVPGGVWDGMGDDEYYCSTACSIEAMRDV